MMKVVEMPYIQISTAEKNGCPDISDRTDAYELHLGCKFIK